MTVIIRPAVEADQPAIRALVRQVRINPLQLQWQHFVVADDEQVLVGIGQLKPHRDGSLELASIAVLPSRQGEGIATAVITQLLAQRTGRLLLLCPAPMEAFYRRFGFRQVPPGEASRSLRRWYQLAQVVGCVLRMLRRPPPGLLIMGRDD
ncbi:MAG: hypothetical protein NVS2B7_32100 [Herpetosiphon sp.]